MKIYLIAPISRSADDGTLENAISTPQSQYALLASAGIASIAGWFPKDLDIRLCDEIVEDVDFDYEADIVGLSINVSQMERGLEIAREFRRRGRKVVIGGPHVSLAPHLFQGEADHLVIGEFEPIADRFIKDLTAGLLAPKYHGGQADLAKMPVPRWDIYPNSKTLAGVIQTSRGCPFECNFCDVIQYVGRKQRHKPADSVIAEANTLYKFGYRHIMLSDDNFTVYRRRSMDLLKEISKWNGCDNRDPVSFSTQASIDLARSPELLKACNDAGLRMIFVGIETDNEVALEAAGKRQNLRIDPRVEVEKIVAAGISVRAGIMVGFDSDDLTCFERQFVFAQSLPVALFNVSALVAPISTPLYDEMKKAGRIIEEEAGATTVSSSALSNLIPVQMTREQLAQGRMWLKNELLDPDNTIARFERIATLLGAPSIGSTNSGSQQVSNTPMLELLRASHRDRGARRVIEAVNELMRQRPEIAPDLGSQLMIHLNEYRTAQGEYDRK